MQAQLYISSSGSGRNAMPQMLRSHVHGLLPLTQQWWALDPRQRHRSQRRWQPSRALTAIVPYSLSNSSAQSSFTGRAASLRRQAHRHNHTARQRRSRLPSHPIPRTALEAEEAVTDRSELSGLELQHGASVRLVSAKGGEYTVEGSMDAAADADSVFQLLCDYERVADVFSNVLRSSTFRITGADTRLQQVCRWEFLVFSGKFPLELTVAEQPQRRSVTFSLADSPFVRSFQGTWQVDERLGGGCRVQHVMAVSPTLAPPRPLAFYTRRVLERQVATIMEDLGRALAAEQ